MDNITYEEKAKFMYEKHLERMRNYSKNHREKTRETAKKQYQKIREDPEKYKLYLERRKKEYHARKQKKLQKTDTDEVQVQIVENDDELEFKDITFE
jgi:hypothetical protein